MLSLAIAIAISASIMRAVSTLVERRFKPQYFTRKRKMPFHDLLKGTSKNRFEKRKCGSRVEDEERLRRLAGAR